MVEENKIVPFMQEAFAQMAEYIKRPLVLCYHFHLGGRHVE